MIDKECWGEWVAGLFLFRKKSHGHTSSYSSSFTSSFSIPAEWVSDNESNTWEGTREEYEKMNLLTLLATSMIFRVSCHTESLRWEDAVLVFISSLFIPSSSLFYSMSSLFFSFYLSILFLLPLYFIQCPLSFIPPSSFFYSFMIFTAPCIVMSLESVIHYLKWEWDTQTVWDWLKLCEMRLIHTVCLRGWH